MDHTVEDCLAHLAKFGPDGDRCVPGLNFKSRDSLSALEPSDQGPTYIRKFRFLPFFSASAWSKFNIVVVNDDIWNSCFHSPGSYRVPTTQAAYEGHPR